MPITANGMSNTHEMVVDTLLAVEIFIASSMKKASLFVVACQDNNGVLYYTRAVHIEVQLANNLSVLCILQI